MDGMPESHSATRAFIRTRDKSDTSIGSVDPAYAVHASDDHTPSNTPTAFGRTLDTPPRHPETPLNAKNRAAPTFVSAARSRSGRNRSAQDSNSTSASVAEPSGTSR